MAAQKKITFETVSAKAQAMADDHKLSAAWIRDKLSSKVDSLTEDELTVLDKELDDKLKAHADKAKPKTAAKTTAKATESK